MSFDVPSLRPCPWLQWCPRPTTPPRTIGPPTALPTTSIVIGIGHWSPPPLPPPRLTKTLTLTPGSAATAPINLPPGKEAVPPLPPRTACPTPGLRHRRQLSNQAPRTQFRTRDRNQLGLTIVRRVINSNHVWKMKGMLRMERDPSLGIVSEKNS
jgi:hypothetical protein